MDSGVGLAGETGAIIAVSLAFNGAPEQLTAAVHKCARTPVLSSLFPQPGSKCQCSKLC